MLLFWPMSSSTNPGLVTQDRLLELVRLFNPLASPLDVWLLPKFPDEPTPGLVTQDRSLELARLLLSDRLNGLLLSPRVVVIGASLPRVTPPLLLLVDILD